MGLIEMTESKAHTDIRDRDAEKQNISPTTVHTSQPSARRDVQLPRPHMYNSAEEFFDLTYRRERRKLSFFDRLTKAIWRPCIRPPTFTHYTRWKEACICTHCKLFGGSTETTAA